MRWLTHGATALLAAGLAWAGTAWLGHEADSAGPACEVVAVARLSPADFDRLSDAVVAKLEARPPTERPSPAAVTPTPAAPVASTELAPSPSPEAARQVERDARHLVDVMVATQTIDREQMQQLRLLMAKDRAQLEPVLGQLLAAINRGDVRPPEGDPSNWLP